ncbi:MAG: hypothetical protein ACTHOE_14795 [Conexibacter sp.]
MADVSLKGLGEPLQQLRGGAKDLDHRNRQRRLRGDLELLDHALALGLRYGAYDEETVAAIAREKVDAVLGQIARPRPRPRLPRWRVRSARPAQVTTAQGSTRELTIRPAAL